MKILEKEKNIEALESQVQHFLDTRYKTFCGAIADNKESVQNSKNVLWFQQAQKPGTKFTYEIAGEKFCNFYTKEDYVEIQGSQLVASSRILVSELIKVLDMTGQNIYNLCNVRRCKYEY